MSANIHLITVVGSYVKVLPSMLEHYRELGIESFFVNLHLTGESDPIQEEVREIATRFGCGIASVHTGDWQSLQQDLYALQRHRYRDDWFVLADQDELQHWPQSGLRQAITSCEAQGYDYIRGCFLDRIAADGSFPALREDLPLAPQFPLCGFISHPILHADPRKVVAVKGSLRLFKGQHHAMEGRAAPIREQFIPVHHFKWTAGIDARLRERLAALRKNGVPHWIESARFLEYYERSGGHLNLADPNLHIAPAEPEYANWEAVKKLVLRLPVPPPPG